MAKNNFLSWDTTANNNTDAGGVNIAEGCAPSGINNAIREIMAQLRAGIDGEMVYVTKAVNYTAVANDNNGVIECSAALTLTLTAVAMLGANWHLWVYANGGDVTIDPNASELINGAATLVIPNGSSALVISTGSAFRAIITRGAPPYSVKTGAYTAVSADNGGTIRFTTAATLSLTAAATLGSGWRVKVIAYGVDVTIDPNSSEQINGTATFILKSGQTADIVCDGSAFWADVHGDTFLGPQIQGYASGLALTTAADAANDVTIAAGAAASDTSPYYLMQLASALTKQIDASWAVGNNAGGLDTGAVGNNTYYKWLIQRSDTGVVDALFSLSSTAPTMPTNYDRKRLIGFVGRASATNGAPVSYLPGMARSASITLSSTLVDIPIGAAPAGKELQEITLGLTDVTLSAAQGLMARFMVAGSAVTSGYVGSTSGGAASVATFDGTTYISLIHTSAISVFRSITLTLYRHGAGSSRWRWALTGQYGSPGFISSSGYIDLAGEPTGIRVSTATGAPTFTNGNASLTMEYI